VPALPLNIVAISLSTPQDLQGVSAKWAVSSIQLRFTFMRGLHPFYPPRLEVVRPHLASPLPGALASHPLLRLEHWDPWMNMSQLLERIKEFLEVRSLV
jgi:baculoviral IAP repeat-containing protein 6